MIFSKKKNKFLSHEMHNLLFIGGDLTMAVGGVMLGLWVTGWSSIVLRDIESTTGFIILSLVTISFFQTYHLYNYNFLFSRKEHIKNLAKSLWWASLTIAFVIILLDNNHLLNTDVFLFLIIFLCSAVILLLLSNSLWGHLLNLLMAFGMAFFTVGITSLACKNDIPACMKSEYLILTCVLFAFILLVVNRLYLVHTVFFKLLRRRSRRQIVIIGSDSDAEHITRHIVSNDAPFWVVGTLGGQSNLIIEKALFKKRLGDIEILPDIINQHDIDDVVITDESISKKNLTYILDYCTSAGINAWFSPKLLPIIEMKLFLDNFCGIPMILLCSQKNSALFNRVKYCLDAMFSLLLLLILSPFIIIIALAIKLDSPGPILYRFQAIGENGAIYIMNKFRSMRANSDNKIHKEYVSKLINGKIGKEKDGKSPLKIVNDPRVTRVGRFIRKYSIDELPQLINVLQGSMSLIGPRPCLPYEFEMYQDWYKKRTSVRPGITGLWQITGRSEVAFEDMILLDLYYIYNRNLVLDFNLLFETFFVVLRKKGAY